MANKQKTVFSCQSCGTIFPKWVGRCTGCGEWDTVIEEMSEQRDPKERSFSSGSSPLPASKIETTDKKRIATCFSEFNHILGGGIVPGAVMLVGGDPGIGKSTLLLQISQSLARTSGQVLYVSGEESALQIKLRAERLNTLHDNLLIYIENDMSRIIDQVEKIKPALVVIDSIQTVFLPELPTAAGSVGQVRECALKLTHCAKTLHIPVFLIGHVTKDGTIAGPRVLEHMVDTVLYFEGDRNNIHRIVRVIKNRYGAANEIAIFEMKTEGLAEVLNPSEIFLSERSERQPGSVVAAAMEGTRPLLVEVQALASRMTFGYPQRTSTGMDQKRLALLCAVLERVADYPLSSYDVFLNIAGGLRLDEPAIDLAAACAVVSSFLNKPIDRKACIIGEIGLGGEVRSISFCEQRIREAQKLGFNSIFIPWNNAQKIAKNPTITVTGVRTVAETISALF